MQSSRTRFKELKYCPKCHKQYSGYPAISRVDNKTEICSKCGQIEALEAVWKWRVK